MTAEFVTELRRQADRVLWLRASPEPNTGCWLWTGPLRGKGYGHVRLNGKPLGAHRAAWIGDCVQHGRCDAETPTVNRCVYFAERGEPDHKEEP